MLSRLDLRGVAGDLRPHLPLQSSSQDEGPLQAVRDILAAVRERGDDAVREFTSRFDGVELDDLRVSDADVAAGLAAIDSDLRASLEASAANVADFHRSQLPADHTYDRDGLVITGTRRPVDVAGCYVPGGRAAYPSTVIMTAVPARVAGVERVVVCAPPDDQGRVPDSVLAAAAIAEVDDVYRIGGAQAVGAMAFGTDTIPAVDLIVGPGNVYVALAKREVAGLVGVPSAFAGPSEIVVVADSTTPLDYAAIDVVVQAEHGPGGQAWLITWEESVADAVAEAVARIAATTPRADDVAATLSKGGYVALVDSPEQAVAVANLVAPEHLQLMCADAASLIPLVRHAGAVFCGPLAPASLGDYIAGPSHVLPTSGTARFAGPLTTEDFTKALHVVEVDQNAFDRLAPHVATIADAEGLACHAESVRLRGAP